MLICTAGLFLWYVLSYQQYYSIYTYNYYVMFRYRKLVTVWVYLLNYIGRIVLINSR